MYAVAWFVNTVCGFGYPKAHHRQLLSVHVARVQMLEEGTRPLGSIALKSTITSEVMEGR